MSTKCITCEKVCSYRTEDYVPEYVALLARHNALCDAVAWMLYIDTPENFEGGKYNKARAEVDRLLTKENKSGHNL